MLQLPELARLCGHPVLQLRRCTFLRGRRGDESVASTRPGPGFGTRAASRHEDAQHRAEPCLEPAPPCRRRSRWRRIGRSRRRRANVRARIFARALAWAPRASSACVCPSARCHFLEPAKGDGEGGRHVLPGRDVVHTGHLRPRPLDRHEVGPETVCNFPKRNLPVCRLSANSSWEQRSERVASGRGPLRRCGVCLWRSCTSGVECMAQLAVGTLRLPRAVRQKGHARGHKGLADGGEGERGVLRCTAAGGGGGGAGWCSQCTAPAALAAVLANPERRV